MLIRFFTAIASEFSYFSWNGNGSYSGLCKKCPGQSVSLKQLFSTKFYVTYQFTSATWQKVTRTCWSECLKDRMGFTFQFYDLYDLNEIAQYKLFRSSRCQQHCLTVNHLYTVKFRSLLTWLAKLIVICVKPFDGVILAILNYCLSFCMMRIWNCLEVCCTAPTAFTSYFPHWSLCHWNSTLLRFCSPLLPL